MSATEHEKIKRLMSRRVKDPNKECLYEQEMTKDEIIARRAELRKILLGTMFHNSTNEVLDGIRVDITEYGFLVEDENGKSWLLGIVKKSNLNI